MAEVALAAVCGLIRFAGGQSAGRHAGLDSAREPVLYLCRAMAAHAHPSGFRLGFRCESGVALYSYRTDLFPDISRHADGSAKIGRATSELQSLMRISYAVLCLKKNIIHIHTPHTQI